MNRTMFALVATLAACGGDDGTTLVLDASIDAAVVIDAPPEIDAPPARSCEGSTALFCEDFDDLPVGPATSARWTTETANGTVAIDDEHARAGHAFHASTMANGRARMFVPVAPPGNSMYGRANIYVTAFPTAPQYAHFTMVEARGASGAVVRPIGGQFIPNQTPPANLLGPGSDGGASGDWTDWNAAAPAQAGTWVCYEWKLDGATNQIDVWIDGVAKPELSTGPARHANFAFPTFTQVWFGWWLYQANPAPMTFDVWVDDIAIDTTRVGCLPQ